MSAGKLVRLFFADGTPGGLLTAETMDWTGHVFAAPRSENGDSAEARREPYRHLHANVPNEWVARGSRVSYGEWQRHGVEDAVKGAAR